MFCNRSGDVYRHLDSDVRLDITGNGCFGVQNVSTDELLESLNCTRNGLTTQEGLRRLRIFGRIKLLEKARIIRTWEAFAMLAILCWVADVLNTYCFLFVILAKGYLKFLDFWQIFLGFSGIVLNYVSISLFELSIGDTTALSLMSCIWTNPDPKTKVLRDECWRERDAGILVPGDIIKIKEGDIVPFDVHLLNGGPIKINEEPFTKTKHPGEKVSFGSICKEGEAMAVVTSIGTMSNRVYVGIRVIINMTGRLFCTLCNCAILEAMRSTAVGTESDRVEGTRSLVKLFVLASVCLVFRVAVTRMCGTMRCSRMFTRSLEGVSTF